MNHRISIGPIRPPMRQTWTLSLSELRADRALYAVIAVYLACAFAYHRYAHAPFGDAFGMYGMAWASYYLFLFPAVLLLTGYIRITLRLDKRRRLAYRSMFAPRRLARFMAGTCLIFALWPFQTAFTSVKNAISGGGFLYDRAQADIDRSLHFGVDPWEFLYALSDNRFLLSALEFNYGVLWIVFGYGVLYLFAILPSMDRFRIRFVICFLLTWVLLGNVLAGIFISAGPAFYGFVTGDTERFALLLDLLARNAGAEYSAAFFQDYLWTMHQADKAGFASGISAFPSMHVGLAMMNALFLFEYNKKWGCIALGYALLILVSSVYLGWHYAIDGYVSVAVVLVIYFIARRVSENFGSRPEAGRSRLLEASSPA